jgi:hypothetical protein
MKIMQFSPDFSYITLGPQGMNIFEMSLPNKVHDSKTIHARLFTIPQVRSMTTLVLFITKKCKTMIFSAILCCFFSYQCGTFHIGASFLMTERT